MTNQTSQINTVENELSASSIKHLEIIQAVITRMNSNSFQIKGWTITIVSALLALYGGKDENTTFILIAIAPTILFWDLDAYYLQQEKVFRKLYSAAVRNEVESFDMPLQNYPVNFWDVFWSKTMKQLYGFVSLILLVSGLVLKYNDCISFNC